MGGGVAFHEVTSEIAPVTLHILLITSSNGGFLLKLVKYRQIEITPEES